MNPNNDTTATYTYNNSFTNAVLRQGFEAVFQSPIKQKPEKKRTSDEIFLRETRRRINNGAVLSKKTTKRYMRLVKKNKHPDSFERRALHSPEDDSGKDMSSLEIDDVVNIES